MSAGAAWQLIQVHTWWDVQTESGHADKVNAQAGVEDQRTSVRAGPALSAVTVSSRREKASFGVVWLCLNPLLRVALAGTVTASTGWESLDCLPLPQLPPGPQRPWLGTMCFQGSGINYLPSLRYLSFSHLGWSSSLWGQACSAFSAEHVLIVGMRAPSGFSLAALQFPLAETAILSVLGGICDTVALWTMKSIARVKSLFMK